MINMITKLFKYRLQIFIMIISVMLMAGCPAPVGESDIPIKTPSPNAVPTLSNSELSVLIAINPNRTSLFPGETVVLSLIKDSIPRATDVSWKAVFADTDSAADTLSQNMGNIVTFTAPEVSEPVVVIVTATADVAGERIPSSVFFQISTPTEKPLQLTTNDDADEYNASYSSDKRYLMYESDFPIEDRFHVYALDTSDNSLHQLSPTWDSIHASFSPDDSQIVYSSNFEDGRHIYLQKFDTQELPNKLTSGPEINQYPSFDSSGELVVFESNRRGNWDIYLVNVDGTNERMIIGSERDERFPRLSPDGEHVVYQMIADGNWEIFIQEVNEDSVPNRLTFSEGRDATPVFSPDGQQIAFESDRSGDYEIYVMDISGDNQKNITLSPSTQDQVPMFSPNGQSLLFQSTAGISWDIFETPLKVD